MPKAREERCGRLGPEDGPRPEIESFAISVVERRREVLREVGAREGSKWKSPQPLVQGEEIVAESPAAAEPGTRPEGLQ